MYNSVRHYNFYSKKCLKNVSFLYYSDDLFFCAGAVRGGGGDGKSEHVAQQEDARRATDSDRRRPRLGPKSRPHDNDDPGLGRADHLL